MMPKESYHEKDQYQGYVEPGFQLRASTWNKFKGKRIFKKYHASNSITSNLKGSYNKKNCHDDREQEEDESESKYSKLEYEVFQQQIQELEQYKYEAELSIEKAETEVKLEKERADIAEKEVETLRAIILQLTAEQKEKDSEYSEYKTAAEFYISKSDAEKEEALQRADALEQLGKALEQHVDALKQQADANEKEFLKLQRTANYWQRQFEDQKFRAIKEEQKKCEAIRKSQAQCLRFIESLKDADLKIDKLDLEAMKCRRALVNAEEQVNQICKSAKKLTSKCKDLQPTESEADNRKEILMKKLYKGLKSNNRSLKQLKNSLSTHLPVVQSNTFQITKYHHHQSYFECQSGRTSSRLSNR